MLLSRRLLCSLVLALTPLAALGQTDTPIIAAASDLKFAATEIAAAFKTETGMEVTLVFGSTGNFATQIREGAPFQMFMAADETYVAELAAEGLTRDAGALYAEGRIVMIVPKGSGMLADGSLESLRAALARGPKLVLGENVSQAAQFATSGDAQGGIIAYSLALAPEVSALGDYALIPAAWHSPLQQRMVLLKSAGPVAEAFYAYMNSDPARAIMERYGFALPQ